MRLRELLKDVQTIAILCNQWGDTGKGKFSDYFASRWADVIARGTGGNNAGHTVVRDGKKRIFQSLPAGIAYDALGKINILGNGMVLDLTELCCELDALTEAGGSFDHLMISGDAHVIMPYHVARDRKYHQSQEKDGIGSTGKGIGPCYADKIARRGIRVGDLFDLDALAVKLKKALAFYPGQDLSIEQIVTQLTPLAARIKPLVRDTVAELHRLLKQGKKVLLEGAQGLLLSVEHGTYPYVTSSDPSLNGTAAGAGLSAGAVDLPLGILKFPFMTRVGGGPFPTELGSTRAREHCRDRTVTKTSELEQHHIPHEARDGETLYDPRHEKIRALMNSPDPFQRGVGIRLAAREYGAVTDRPRRVGWTDAVAARYAIMVNSTPRIILTKADALAGMDDYRICFDYSDGPADHLPFRTDTNFLQRVTPVYRQYAGYSDISSVRDEAQLPASLREAIADFEKFTRSSAVMVSVGPEAEETIVR